LKRKEKRIAQALMAANPRVKTVLAKVGGVYGVYRKRRLRHIAGAKNYIADYRENGCTFKFDVRQVFFSSKLSFERSRITSLVRNKERVIVVGAGVGPFVIEIAKGHPDAIVFGIEPNKNAYDAMKHNIEFNKTQNAKAELGDVRKVCGRYAGYADRIIVPMPTVSLDFLNQIIMMAKRKSTIHLYVFGSAESVLADSWRKIRTHAKEEGYKTRMLSHRVVRPYSAKDVELVMDFGVDKISRK
jgi:tRNA (guanine37-N1)-methyltransferase